MRLLCLQVHLQQLLQDVNGKHLLKVEPLNAILDPQYFVRAVHQCTLSVLHGREADAFQNAAENAGFGYHPFSSHCEPWTNPTWQAADLLSVWVSCILSEAKLYLHRERWVSITLYKRRTNFLWSVQAQEASYTLFTHELPAARIVISGRSFEGFRMHPADGAGRHCSA